ncbi:MAG: fasciclin domain-containing protein [Anaerolineae bacterium]|nr:fasciclin domain-containing protein [Anaerolineae bacterium]
MIAVLTLLITIASSAFAAPAYQGDQDIVDTLTADGRFTTLVKALETADLVDVLKGEGPFTVFAPTDAAFDALPEGTLDTLMADVPALTDVLLYHVIPNQVMAVDVATLDSAPTVLGASVPVSSSNGNVMIDGANVIVTDMEASNGVIHVIDAVLIPEGVAASLESGTMTKDEAMVEEDTPVDEAAMAEEQTVAAEETTMTDSDTVVEEEPMAAEEATMADSSAATEGESPAGLPSTGGHYMLLSFIIVGFVLVGMILALGGLALRVGIGLIK